VIPATAIVINLARRADRLETFLARWNATGLDVVLDVLEATDGAREKPADPRWSKFPTGVWGCWDSHRRALARPGRPALIMEDDCVFAPNFGPALAALTAPSGWDVIHLGGQHLIRPDPVVCGLVAPRRMLRSHAYLAANPQTLSAALRGRRTHVDYALGLLPLARYAVDPWLVGQDGSPGDITRTTASQTEFWQEGERRGA
jgi:hypothetical protein